MSFAVNEPPIAAVMGPTASGKSALAIELARKIGGEIISMDSMQLYRGLEIGTAQPTREERQNVPHHLLGCFDLQERMELFRFLELAERTILEIRKRGRIPVLAGGTGLYFKSLFYGVDALPGNRELRQELDTLYDSPEGEGPLKARLQKLDPAALEKFQRCRRRMIRALEVYLLSGKSLLELQKNQPRQLRFPVRAFVLDPEVEVLKKKISERARLMLNSGWIEEAERAIAAGLLTSPTARQAIGYALIDDFLKNKISRSELESRIVTATWQFARRQRTWFRHQHPEAQVLTTPVSALPN